jgi:outer membrane protein TolC
VDRAYWRRGRVVSPTRLALGAAALLFMAGCSTSHYRNSADKEASRAIAQKAAAVPNMDRAFTIERTNVVSLAGLPIATNVADFLEAGVRPEAGAPMVSLHKALEFAVNHSRIYQSRKEQVYLEALSLTLARHQFAPILAAGPDATYEVNTVRVVEPRVDPVTGQLQPVLSDSLVERDSVRANGSLNVNWLIRDVGRVSAAFTTDFFRFLRGNPATLGESQLAATLVRPLWRNANFKAEMENLTLAERGLLYAMREYTRFRKQFAVDVASAYYRVLQSRDTARNTWLGYQNFKRSAARTRALVLEGRVKQADLGRLEQQELSQEVAWVAGVRNYKLALDNFKLQLGLPMDMNLALDDTELQALTIHHPHLSADDAIRLALAARLDLQNLRQQREDSERAITVAASRLKPQVDLVASAGFSSPQETSTRLAVPDINRYRWSAGLNVDPGLDRKGERNNYRAALIRREQAARAVIEAEDTMKLQVREDLRLLDQAKRTYQNSELGVKLAERRLEEQNLLAELGRGRAQDQVDAQNDLTAAKNQRTQALVEHTIARLRFWEHLGILYIKQDGQFLEGNNTNELRQP